MNPDSTNPQGENPNLQKLEEDLQRLSQEVQQTPSVGTTPTPPVTPDIPQQPVTPSIETTPPSAPLVHEVPKQGSPLSKIATALIVVAFLAIAAYFVGNMYLNKKTPAPTSTTTNSPTPVATLDPTASWEIYANQKYSFSFKYPVGLVVQEAQNSNYEVLLRDKNQVPVLDILVAQKIVQLDDTFQTQIPKTIEKLTWQAYYSPKILGGPDPTKNTDELQLHLQQNGRWFILRFYGQKELTDTQYQILSTFKFLEKDTLKTYTSPEVAEFFSPFQISYPTKWTLYEEKTSNPNQLIIRLSSTNGSTIKISQIAGDGGRCLYTTDSDDSSYEGAGRKFSSYTQLNTPAEWRLSAPVNIGGYTHEVCEISQGNYIDTTRIGFVQVVLTDSDNISEIKKILESVQFKPTSSTKTLFD